MKYELKRQREGQKRHPAGGTKADTANGPTLERSGSGTPKKIETKAILARFDFL